MLVFSKKKNCENKQTKTKYYVFDKHWSLTRDTIKITFIIQFRLLKQAV